MRKKRTKDGEAVVMLKKTDIKKGFTKLLFVCLFVVILGLLVPGVTAFALELEPVAPVPGLDEVAEILEDVMTEGVSGSATLNILFLSVLIILLPSLLVISTSFLRLIIIFSFLRSGMGTNQMPPNTVLIGLALVLTMFFMNDYLAEINENALQPLSAGEITTAEAIDNTIAGLRRFMLGQNNPGSTNNLESHIVFFGQIANHEFEVNEYGFVVDNDTIPNYILFPAFVLHELTLAFAFGVLVFIPFIIIDMVVASVLMAMGMMMLPPVMISLPFKIMLFVLVDGWTLIVNTAALSFR
ncbi:MAG: flagellar type III secretion system pore protein FliP [Defluviitaleaceae bacterium]|nr:flagellar type III secretion system pore protein FliP [Defluviitaleaceae bacterium]